MQEPIGLSGVQTVPNSLQSVGFLAPRRIEGHSQALGVARRLGHDAEAALGVEIGVSFLDAQRAIGNEPQARATRRTSEARRLRRQASAP